MDKIVIEYYNSPVIVEVVSEEPEYYIVYDLEEEFRVYKKNSITPYKYLSHDLSLYPEEWKYYCYKKQIQDMEEQFYSFKYRYQRLVDEYTEERAAVHDKIYNEYQKLITFFENDEERLIALIDYKISLDVIKECSDQELLASLPNAVTALLRRIMAGYSPWVSNLLHKLTNETPSGNSAEQRIFWISYGIRHNLI